MARGQAGEEGYTPQVTPEDLPRKITPQMEEPPVALAFASAADASYKKYQADSATWASDQIAQARIQAVTDLKTAQDIAPAGDQTGFTQKFLSSFDGKTASLTGSSTVQNNPVASAMIQKGLGDLRQTLQTQTMGWEAQQNVAYRQDSFQKNLTDQLPIVEAHPELSDQVGSTLADQVRVMGVEPATQYKLFRTMHEQLSLAAANGLTRQDPYGVLTALNNPERAQAPFDSILQLNDQQREAVRNKANDGLSKPVYSALTDGNTDAAQAHLNSVRDVLDERTAFGLQNTIDAKVKEKQNNQRQDIADRLQDSMTSAQYGLPNPVSVTRAEMDVLYPKDAQRRWDGLQMVVAAGAKAQQYNQMTPEQINADVNASRPTQGGPEAALGIKAFEIRANAADASLRSRQQDPAQFAIDNGNGWQALDLSKPDDMLAQLRSRANTQGSVSESLGVNTPLLSKGEQQQFTGWLTNQAPADRLRTLAALRSSMPNDQAYASLLKQVAPGSPLTAIAGSMLDRPAQGAVPNWFNPSFTIPPIVPTRILEGEQILQAKDENGIASKFPMPKDTEMMPQFTAAVGGPNSDLFRGRPETLEATYAAFKAYYAAAASQAGVTNGVIDPAIAAKAAYGALGGIATQYGSSNLVPPSGMDPTKFAGVLEDATTRALKAGGYSDSDREALGDAGLRELGSTLGTGRYVMINGNGDPLMTKDRKKPLIIDLNQQYRIPAAPLPSPTAKTTAAGIAGDRLTD